MVEGQSRVPVESLVNLTPHTVRLFVGTERVFELPPSGLAVPRVAFERTEQGGVVTPAGRIPVHRVGRLGPPSLPAAVPGRYLVVSRVVAEACRERTDLLFPDELVRDDLGAVIGCRSFGTVHRFETVDERIFRKG